MDLTNAVPLLVFPDIKGLPRIIPGTGSGIAEALHVKTLFCEEPKIFLLLTGHHHRTGGQPSLPFLPYDAEKIIGAPGV